MGGEDCHDTQFGCWTDDNAVYGNVICPQGIHHGCETDGIVQPINRRTIANVDNRTGAILRLCCQSRANGSHHGSHIRIAQRKAFLQPLNRQIGLACSTEVFAQVCGAYVRCVDTDPVSGAQRINDLFQRIQRSGAELTHLAG